MRHHLLTLHPILLPGGFLITCYAVILRGTPEPEQRLVIVLMVTGIAALVSAWLLLRQYLSTLIIAAQGFEDGRKDLAERIEAARRDISEVRGIPAIRKVLLHLRTEAARAEFGGPDTPTEG